MNQIKAVVFKMSVRVIVNYQKKSRKFCNDYDGFVGSVDSIILAKDRLGHQSYVQGRKFPTSISDHTFATDNENNKDTRSANKCRTL